jgi:hypothetical protein
MPRCGRYDDVPHDTRTPGWLGIQLTGAASPVNARALAAPTGAWQRKALDALLANIGGDGGTLQPD